MRGVAERLSALDDFSAESQKAAIDPWCEAEGVKPWTLGALRWSEPAKVPTLYELSAFLGKEETLRRIQFAIDTLS